MFSMLFLPRSVRSQTHSTHCIISIYALIGSKNTVLLNICEWCAQITPSHTKLINAWRAISFDATRKRGTIYAVQKEWCEFPHSVLASRPYRIVSILSATSLTSLSKRARCIIAIFNYLIQSTPARDSTLCVTQALRAQDETIEPGAIHSLKDKAGLSGAECFE